MRKFALTLATTAMLGMAAPAFAIESGTTTQAQTPAAQTSASAKVKTNVNGTAKVDHHRRGADKLAEHDRGLHRGFNHSRHYGYAKTHHSKSVRAKVTSAQ
jgi:hypothetical protein